MRYSDADGERIFLQNSLVLNPVPAQRPGSVPETAKLAENGVYADCHLTSSKLYHCSMFLAARGEKYFSGSYRCDESLAAPCNDVAPKIADRSEINLQNAGALVLEK